MPYGLYFNYNYHHGYYDPEVEDWDQDPRGILKVYQQQSYKLGESVADLIDNSYDANAKKIEVKIG